MHRIIPRVPLLLLPFIASCGADSDPTDTDAGVDVSDASGSGADAGLPDPTPETPVVDGRAAVASCEEVALSGAPASEGPWTIEGDVLLFASHDPAGRLRFRAPAVAHPETLEVRNGTAVVYVDVAPVPPVPGDAPGLAADCAPFIHGVASGEPTSTGALLWTRLTDPAEGDRSVRWEVAPDHGFVEIAASGEAAADPGRDDTVHVEVDGLNPGTTYYYRFADAQGRTSRLGRFSTAPLEGNSHARLAVATCSSLWSGYFSAYRRLAERSDIDLVVHVGDYIYDSVDPDEEIRLPSVRPESPQTLDEHRARHAYYLLDPDLRAARAAHAWIVIWDNHDLDQDAPPDFAGGVQAFEEWVPMRVPDPSQPAKVWRSLAWGDLIDLAMVDILLWRGIDTVPGTEAPSILGTEQFAWFDGWYNGSTARWRIVGSQKLISPIDVPISIGGSTWLAYPESRHQLSELLLASPVANALFVTGDAHMTFVSDIVDEPAGYDPATGEGAAAAEFLAGSVTRGNVDETIDFGPEFIAEMELSVLESNPQLAHIDFTQHGYGVVDVTRDAITVEMWFSPKLEPADDEVFDVGTVLPWGQRHWSRVPRTTPTSR